MTREPRGAPEDTVARLFGKKLRPIEARPQAMSVADPLFLDALRAGSRAACEGLVREHYVRVYNYLLGLCGNEAQAEDLCQETFLKVWKSARNFAGRSSLLTWVFTIARNAFLDEARRKRPLAVDLDAGAFEIADTAPAVRDTLVRQERSEALQAAIQRLPEQEKSVIMLRYREGLPYRQLAKVLGIPVGTAKYQASRGLARLRKILGGEGHAKRVPRGETE